MAATTPAALVPGPLRWPIRIAVVVAALVFVLLAVHYAGTSAPGPVDARVDAALDPFGAAHRWLFGQAVFLGSPGSVAVLAFVLAAVGLWQRRRRLAVLAVVGPGLTGLCTTVLKPALGRTIDGSFAFPSGHTGGATSLALVAALLAISVIRPSRAAALALLAVGAIVVGGVVAVAMVAANAHYPTDTVGGFCTAVVMVCGSALVLDRVAAARSTSSEAAAET